MSQDKTVLGLVAGKRADKLEVVVLERLGSVDSLVVV
jgi:hypothetical protein